MFTGIITAVGHISAVHPLGSSARHGNRLAIDCPSGFLADVSLGDSISLHGACMTVALLDLVNHQFFVDISVESLSKTVCLGQPGRINLEKALRAGDRLGGHLVSGHVDGVGHVISFKPTGESWDLRLDIPQSLAMYLVYKGSLTVNGVSLTVNQVQDYPGGCEAHINLIPHTVQSTTLGELTHGDVVNLEVDMLAKYVERLSISRGTSPEMKASQ